MELSNLLVITAVVFLILGAGYVLIPTRLLSAAGMTTDVTGTMVTRVVGASLVGWALLAWFGRNVTDPTGQQAITIAFFGVSLAFFGVESFNRLSNPGHARNWIAVVIDALFALAFAYFLFVKRIA